MNLNSFMIIKHIDTKTQNYATHNINMYMISMSTYVQCAAQNHQHHTMNVHEDQTSENSSSTRVISSERGLETNASHP